MAHRSPEEILIEKERILAERAAQDPIRKLDIELAEAKARQAVQEAQTLKAEYERRLKTLQEAQAEVARLDAKALDLSIQIGKVAQARVPQAEALRDLTSNTRAWCDQNGFPKPDRADIGIYGMAAGTIQAFITALVTRVAERLQYLSVPELSLVKKAQIMRALHYPDNSQEGWDL